MENSVPFNLFIGYIEERETIRIKRALGEAPPWTTDPILRSYRFTNVHREADRVTRWIAANWRNPDPDNWFAMLIARMINQPATLARIGYPVPWDKERFIAAMDKPNPGGESLYNAAYMIKADGGEYAGARKHHTLAKLLFDVAWNRREWLRPDPIDSLNSFHMKLMELHNMGSFYAAQVVADVKHNQPLLSASDWVSFAASGPGSRKGLNYLLDRDPARAWREEDWRMELSRLLARVQPPVLNLILDAQDLQNCLCEFSKYMRAYTGAGRPKQNFKPNQEPMS
jgi:alpha-glutamyl/putrescinyl thymine pyrophosphorylase clade 1